MMTDEIAGLVNNSGSEALVLLRKPRKEKWCRHCERWLDVRGFDAHLHFRHAHIAIEEFRWTMLRNYADIFWEAMQ